jgi:hypothetical protein
MKRRRMGSLLSREPEAVANGPSFPSRLFRIVSLRVAVGPGRLARHGKLHQTLRRHRFRGKITSTVCKPAWFRTEAGELHANGWTQNEIAETRPFRSWRGRIDCQELILAVRSRW